MSRDLSSFESAPDINDFVSPLAQLLEGIDFDKIQPVACLDFGEIKTNWKSLMENFIEPYHVQIVHSTTTEQPLIDHYTVIAEACLGSAVDISKSRDSHKTNTLAVNSRYLTLFPNFVLGRYFPDQLGVHLNIPISPGADKSEKSYLYNRRTKIISRTDSKLERSLDTSS